jgi:hypothetical protein
MRFKQFLLSEMPLSNYKFAFSRNPNEIKQKSKEAAGHFSFQDRAIISHPKTAQQLEKILSRHKWKFNFLMLESNEPNYSKLEKDVMLYMSENNIPLQGHITFVKPASSGDPLTVWMHLHVLSHSLFPEDSSNYDKFMRLIREFYASVENVLPDELYQVASSNDIVRFFRNFFVFKSAKEPFLSPIALNALDELLHELTAEFLWNGKIRLNNNIKYVNVKYARLLESVKKFALDAEQLISRTLDRAVGHIIIDHWVG